MTSRFNPLEFLLEILPIIEKLLIINDISETKVIYGPDKIPL